MTNGRRGRRLRCGIASAAVALTMGAGASAAQAVPFQAEFDNAFLKTGAFPNPGLDILGGTSVPPFAEFGGDINLATGAFTVPAGCANPGTPTASGFCFPDFSGTVLGGAVGVTVKLEAIEGITGSVNPTNPTATTLVHNESDFKATLILDFTPTNLMDPVDTCEITPIPMSFNTTQGFPAPYAGDPFDAVLADLATDVLDNGAISTTWASLPAATPVPPTTSCGTVDSLSGGRGGIWIGDNIATPVINAAPPPATTTTPPPATTPKKCKKGQKLKKGKCVKKKKKKK